VRLTAYEIRREAAPTPDDHVTLDYADRFLRRKTLRTAAGHSLFVDLPETLSLDEALQVLRVSVCSYCGID
jgi:urease accessory protein